MDTVPLPPFAIDRTTTTTQVYAFCCWTTRHLISFRLINKTCIYIDIERHVFATRRHVFQALLDKNGWVEDHTRSCWTRGHLFNYFGFRAAAPLFAYISKCLARVTHLQWFGIVCSTWVFMCRSSTGRTALDVMGRPHRAVLIGNAMVSLHVQCFCNF